MEERKENKIDGDEYSVFLIIWLGAVLGAFAILIDFRDAKGKFWNN